MTLAVGCRVGPHEIADLIGSGGMGEVYRATDTSLKRQDADLATAHYLGQR